MYVFILINYYVRDDYINFKYACHTYILLVVFTPVFQNLSFKHCIKSSCDTEGSTVKSTPKTTNAQKRAIAGVSIGVLM